MAKKSAIALAATGVVLVVAGALVKWVGAPALVKAPLDISSTTVAEGPSKVFVLTQQQVRDVPVVATRVVTGDKKAGNGSVAVYDETLCLVARGTETDDRGCASAADPGFIQKTTDRIAFDRVKGTAVPGTKYRAAVNGDTSIVHEGLGYTFPIGTEKKSYPFFDTIAGKAYPAKFIGTDTIRGMEVYRFQQQVPQTDIKIQGLLPGTYEGSTTFWVEPTTGVIIKGSQRIVQKFASNGSTVFDGTLTFTDHTVQKQVDFANSQLTKIGLIRNWIPLALGVIGLALLAWSALLSARPRRTSATQTLAGGVPSAN
jgi:hypothetical protein